MVSDKESNETRQIDKQELIQSAKDEGLKPGVLRDDLFEDLVHREYTFRQGLDEDASLRVTPIYDEEKGEGKLITTGKGKVQDAMDKVLRAPKVEHERVTPKAYPGEEAFESEKVKQISGPRIARTIKAIRETRGVPKPPLVEDVAVDLEEKLGRFLGLGQPRQDRQVSGVEGLRELDEATRGFARSYKESEKEGGKESGLDS